MSELEFKKQAFQHLYIFREGWLAFQKLAKLYFDNCDMKPETIDILLEEFIPESAAKTIQNLDTAISITTQEIYRLALEEGINNPDSPIKN